MFSLHLINISLGIFSSGRFSWGKRTDESKPAVMFCHDVLIAELGVYIKTFRQYSR